MGTAVSDKTIGCGRAAATGWLDSTRCCSKRRHLPCWSPTAWAAHTRHAARVLAALLVAPSDPQRADAPPNLYNWRPIVRQRLPFASLLIASSDDVLCGPAQAAALAADWGSAWCLLGAHGHLNGDSGLGDWDEGRALLKSLA